MHNIILFICSPEARNWTIFPAHEVSDNKGFYQGTFLVYAIKNGITATSTFHNNGTESKNQKMGKSCNREYSRAIYISDHDVGQK